MTIGTVLAPYETISALHSERSAREEKQRTNPGTRHIIEGIEVQVRGFTFAAKLSDPVDTKWDPLHINGSYRDT